MRLSTPSQQSRLRAQADGNQCSGGDQEPQQNPLQHGFKAHGFESFLGKPQTNKQQSQSDTYGTDMIDISTVWVATRWLTDMRKMRARLQK